MVKYSLNEDLLLFEIDPDILNHCRNPKTGRVGITSTILTKPVTKIIYSLFPAVSVR
jgi:hypothetical protein